MGDKTTASHTHGTTQKGCPLDSAGHLHLKDKRHSAMFIVRTGKTGGTNKALKKLFMTPLSTEEAA